MPVQVLSVLEHTHICTHAVKSVKKKKRKEKRMRKEERERGMNNKENAQR